MPELPTLTFKYKTYLTDSWTNIPRSILKALPRRLHLQPSHPIFLTRRLIESHFPKPTYKHYNNLPPNVSVAQNFDSLGFPHDHPGRSRTDTYYINRSTVLRTHTSAHQVDTFARNHSPGFLISADVYRRDAIDRSHYPIFHQMEGARMWDRQKVPDGDIAKAVYKDLATLPTHSMQVSDPNPTTHPERNPLQSSHHSPEEVEALAAHLKRSIELVVADIFTQARLSSLSTTTNPSSSSTATPTEENQAEEPLQIRWIEAYFPFTSPSWELEVFWQGSWLELLGCGIVSQNLPITAGVPSQIGWAFGLGLERIAMLLFGIPDIRLFWSTDERFLNQFSELKDSGLEVDDDGNSAGGAVQNVKNWGFKQFIPFSKYPSSSRDVSFWLAGSSSSASTTTNSTSTTTTTTNNTTSPNTPSPSPSPPPPIHENDVLEIIRDIGGDLVEDAKMIDEFRHQTTGRTSFSYRVVYRSLERTLRNREVNDLHRKVREMLVQRLGVELR
ncbi:MAG: hypothetical protein M1812_004266 [Candelaria pacifica]|nr:MAG: hypothetical protein M1812_004266 [Candelaria pacifica]